MPTKKAVKLLLALIIILSSFYCGISKEPNVGEPAAYIGMRGYHNVNSDTTINNYFQTGLTKFKLNDYSHALIDFKEAIKQSPNNSKIYRFKGEAERKLKMYGDAELSYASAISFNKNDTISIKGRADVRRFRGNAIGAIEDYNKLIEWGLRDVTLYFGRALCYYTLKLYEESVLDFNYCLELYPKAAIIYLNRGNVYYDLKNYKMAIRDFTMSMNLGGEIEANYLRGMAYFFLLKADNAIADLTKYLSKSENESRGYVALGRAYSLKKDSTQVRANFVKALTISPDVYEIYYCWGEAEINLRNYSKAKELLIKALNMGDSSSVLYERLGVAQAMLHDTTGALTSFKRALDKDSTNKDVYQSRINLLLNNKKSLDQLMRDVTSLIKLNTDSFVVSQKYTLRSLFNFHLGDTLKAKLDANKAVQLAPNEPYPYAMRAVVSWLFKQPKELILKDLNRAIKLDNLFMEAYMVRAQIYASIAEYKKGCKDLNIAVKLGASVSREQKNYICTGQVSSNGPEPEIIFTIDPPKERLSERWKKK